MKTLSTLIFFGLVISFGQAQSWNWFYPQYTQYPTKIEFVDENHGFFISETGNFSRSVDGGLSWNTEPLDFTNKIYGLSFVDSLKGWICGEDGLVAKTVDGGRSWQKQNISTSNTLRAIHFISPGIGWLVGEGGVIFTTSNTGNNWSQLPSFNSHRLWDVKFIDSQIGWISGDRFTVAQTTDGGLSWTNKRPPAATAGFLAIDVLDDHNVWLVGETGRVYKTTDAGLNWTNYTNGNNRDDLLGVDFRDSLNGWIVGERGFIQKTEDGGSNWERFYSLTSERLHGVHFFDNNKVYVSNGLISADGGSSWDSVLISEFSEAFDFESPDKGWVAQSSSLLYKTEDGGCSWTEFPLNIPNFSGQFTLREIKVKDSIMILGTRFHGTVAQSNDGGANWITTKFPGSSIDIREIFLFNDSVEYVHARGLRKSTDRGKNWTEISPFGEVYDSYFINQDTGWISRRNEIDVTTDGGLSWTRLTHPDNAYQIRTLYFKNFNEGFASGANILFRTFDGGMSWSRDTLFTLPSFSFGLNITDIAFTDSLNGWIVGGQNLAFHTTDGGSSWQRFNRFDNDQNVRLDMFSNDFGYMGNRGVMKYSTENPAYSRSMEIPLCPDTLSFNNLTITEPGIYPNGIISCDTITTLIVVPGPSISSTLEVMDSVLRIMETFARYQWYRNDSLIVGASGQSYIPEKSGSYFAVIQDSNDCSGTTDTLDFFVSGLETLYEAQDVNVSPNPAKDKLRLRLDFLPTKGMYLEIWDMLGNKILDKQNVSDDFLLDVQDLSSGMYYLKLFDEKDLRIKKFLKY